MVFEIRNEIHRKKNSGRGEWGLDRLEEGGGDIGGGDGAEAFDDDADALLTFVTGDVTTETGEVALGDKDLLTFAELVDGVGSDEDVIVGGGGKDAEVGNLSVGHDEGLAHDGAVDTTMAVVETEEGEMDIVIDEVLDLVFGAVGEKDIGDAGDGFLHFLSALSYLAEDGGAVGGASVRDYVVVGFQFPAVSGAQGIPPTWLLGRMGIVGGHPCV